MPIKKKILITGATGFIGSQLAQLALQSGYVVCTLTRSDWSGQPAVPHTQRYFGRFPFQLPEVAVAGVEAIIHCAAATDGSERTAEAINVQGTLKLAQLARDASVKTFIFLSSQSAQPAAISAYGRSKYAAEQALLALDGINIIILRPGLVWGPGSQGLFQRMCETVAGLPVIPLLGGGHSIVQGIHVDDLCKGIFTCVERGAELRGSVLSLGDAQGMPLAHFLQVIARARLGKAKTAVKIPLWPVELAVRVAETLKVPLPINSNNLKGMKVVQKMETAADLARLGLSLRPPEAMQPEDVRATKRNSITDLKERAVRMLLIGAGRIGIVHALTLHRLRGIDFSGIVDPKSGSVGMLRGMGLKTPAHASLDEALAQTPADAAVIATPTATHYKLAQTALSHGLDVMIEKPLAIRRDQLRDYQQLAADFPARKINVGYVMPRNPQVSSWIDRLRNGELGKVHGFMGLTLLSLIEEPAERWEVKKEISGGGVFINSGGHVLSMIHAAFGAPTELQAESLKLHSTEVEDSMVIRMRYPDFEGVQCCSWSISGTPRQENRLIIWTDAGQLVLTGSVGVLIRHDGIADVAHQLDFDVGFNLAPDYAGGGFSTELNDLANAVRTRQTSPLDLGEAMRIEELLFNVYEAAREVKHFDLAQNATAELGRVLPVTAVKAAATKDNNSHAKRVLDLRELSAQAANTYLSQAAQPQAWNEYLLWPGQLTALSKTVLQTRQLRVTAPDFLNQARLLSGGRAGEVVKQMGIGGIFAAGLAAAPLALREGGPKFWVAALGLLAADLTHLPADFTGTILLHSYLTDLALALDRVDVIETMLKTCRRSRPQAQIGFHTSLAGDALNALAMIEAKVDQVSVLTSPLGLNLSEIIGAFKQATGAPLFVTAEVGPAPAWLHQAAAQSAGHWLHGADAILLNAAADQQLAAQHQNERNAAWAKVFPGMTIPDVAL